jgi:hypothetical protein
MYLKKKEENFHKIYRGPQQKDEGAVTKTKGMKRA